MSSDLRPWVFLLSMGALLIACGGGGRAPADLVPPTVSNVQVTPNRLPFTGGTVRVSATVTDPSGVSSVWVQVRGPDGSERSIALTNAGGSVYQGELTLGPATTPDGQDAEYRVWVLARDARGNTTARSGPGLAIIVTAPNNPPIPPSI